MRQLERNVFGDENAGKANTNGKKKGKKQKKGEATTDNVVWKKKSIFFRLPYLKDNLSRHNFNVTHMEKNVMDNILGTILDIKGKTKDDLVARTNLQEMGLRPKLHPCTADDCRTYLPAACHKMFKDDKTHFLKVLRNVRVPDRYGSNVSQSVRLKECMIFGLKSHDSHVLMQQLLSLLHCVDHCQVTWLDLLLRCLHSSGAYAQQH